MKSLFVNMATGYTREWIRFFTGCGIPDDIATMYALIFYENRIQKNMLLDLNKEYLRDMGITVMGDVIAILRYAKVVHKKYVREQILSVEEAPVETRTTSNESSPVGKKSTPMKRMLEHYTRKCNSLDFDSVSEVQIILPNEKSIPVQKKLAQKIGMQNNVLIKKKIAIPIKQTDLMGKGLEIPVPKVRRVLPENEGGYKIKMPSGTTERSKKLLEQAKKRKTKTVFERLGESSVSSTTSDISTGTSSSTASLTSSREKNLSVFSRLGEKTSIVSSTSIDDSEYVEADQLQLPYAGILKSGGSVQKKNLPSTTMRADDEQQKSEVSKLNSKKGISVKRRLGVSKEGKQSLKTEPTKRTVLKAVKRANLQKGEEAEASNLRLSNKFNSSTSRVKVISQTEGILAQNFSKNRTESSQAKATPGAASQIQAVGERILKRKLGENSDFDVIPSKKVRFGRTTHRLIPSSSSSTEPVNHLKNYPKLTMIINNRNKPADNDAFSSGIKIGLLNSDRIRQKVAVQERIGTKSVRGRLGRRVDERTSDTPKKRSNIHERLG